ncbi:MAG: amidohydrolase [Microbacteriaceae bacterium]
MARGNSIPAALSRLDDASLDALIQDYAWFHAHPGLAYREHEAAQRIDEIMRGLGYETHAGIGGTGVVAVLANGDGPVVALRADIDGLPVLERTGLPYASTITQLVDGSPVPVMHACGHDIHISSAIGTARLLAATRDRWSGTVEFIFQPAEEGGVGAAAVVDSGIFDTVPVPELILGQHVIPGSYDEIKVTPGALEASSDSWRVVLRGSGGHGAWPHEAEDLVVAAADAIALVQNVVARQTPAMRSAVVTIASIHIGSKENVIADGGYFTVNIRAHDPEIRRDTWTKVRRAIDGALAANGISQPAEYVAGHALPPLINSPEPAAVVAEAFRTHLPTAEVVAPEPVMGSEDFGILGERLGVPSMYWFIGSMSSAVYDTLVARGPAAADFPRLHSPYFAPEPRPTLDVGVRAMTIAALAHLESR